MAVGILAVSTSGPLMAAIVGAGAGGRDVAQRARDGGDRAVRPAAPPRPELRRLVRAASGGGRPVAGLLLALHFATWVPSLRYTSVASATAIVATQPVWVALIARGPGHYVPRRAWLGIAVALFAVIVLTGVDFSLDPQALIGDLLALVGGIFSALYTVAGAEVRRTVTTTSYTVLCYGDCGRRPARGLPGRRRRLWGFSGKTWLQLLALTFGAQLLGHSVINGCCARRARRSSRWRCCSRSRARR